MSALKFMTRLGLSIGSVLTATAALAAPASVFDPILDDISTDNPAIPVFRIPAAVPTTIELHPSIMPEAGIIFLDTEPGCEAIACTALVVIAQSEPPPLWPFLAANSEDSSMESVDLVDGVQAYFWERDGMGSLQWLQDDAMYVLSYNQFIFSKEQAITMATSMAAEPPYLP